MFRILRDDVHQSQLHTVQGAGIIHQSDGKSGGVATDIVIGGDSESMEVPVLRHFQIYGRQRHAHHLAGLQGTSQIQTFHAIRADSEDGGRYAFDRASRTDTETGEMDTGDVVASTHPETGEMDSLHASSRAHSESGDSETGHVFTGSHPENGSRCAFEIIASGQSETADTDTADASTGTESESAEGKSADVATRAKSQSTECETSDIPAGSGTETSDREPAQIVFSGDAHQGDSKTIDVSRSSGDQSDRGAVDVTRHQFIFRGEHGDIDSADVLDVTISIIQPESRPFGRITNTQAGVVSTDVDLCGCGRKRNQTDQSCQYRMFHKSALKRLA